MRKIFSLLALLLFSSPCWALPAYVQKVDTGTKTNVFASTTAGNMLVTACYGIGTHSNFACTAVADSHSSMTQISTLTSNTAYASVWALYGIAGGADTVTCTAIDASTKCYSVELSGVNAVNACAANACMSSGTGVTTTSATVTTTQANVLLLAVGGPCNTCASVSAFDPAYTGITNANEGLSYKIVSSTGSYSESETLSGSSDWVEGLVAFYQSGGAAPAKHAPPMMMSKVNR